jgi:hypothetical protein
MYIGLYGDSFTTSAVPAKPFAWYNLLAKKLGGEIYSFYDNMPDISYGLGGSSTFYSYKYFLKYYKQHDYNIFIASDPTKYPKLINLNGRDVVMPGIRTLNHYIQNENLPQSEIEYLNKLHNWFLVNDEEYMEITQELILRDIEEKSKDKLLMLAAVVESAFNDERRKSSTIKFGMWDFVHIMWRSLGIDMNDTTITNSERPDKIAAHMTEEANNVLADLLFDHIKYGKEIVLPKHIPHRYDINYYFGN